MFLWLLWVVVCGLPVAFWLLGGCCGLLVLGLCLATLRRLWLFFEERHYAPMPISDCLAFLPPSCALVHEVGVFAANYCTFLLTSCERPT